jgi:virulence-associated protein VapD
VAGRGKNKRASEALKEEPPKIYARKWGNQFSKAYNDYEIEQIADEMFDWFQVEGNVWLKDFAISKMIGAQRISEFAAQNKYFSFIYSLCKEKQESVLFKLGLSSKSSMPYFALKNVAKWRDNPQEEFNIDINEMSGRADKLSDDEIKKEWENRFAKR